MTRLFREFRLLPIVLFAALSLFALKTFGLLFDGGYILTLFRLDGYDSQHRPIRSGSRGCRIDRQTTGCEGGYRRGSDGSTAGSAECLSRDSCDCSSGQPAVLGPGNVQFSGIAGSADMTRLIRPPRRQQMPRARRLKRSLLPSWRHGHTMSFPTGPMCGTCRRRSEQFLNDCRTAVRILKRGRVNSTCAKA